MTAPSGRGFTAGIRDDTPDGTITLVLDEGPGGDAVRVDLPWRSALLLAAALASLVAPAAWQAGVPESDLRSAVDAALAFKGNA